MGVKGLLQELSGTSMEEMRCRFLNLKILANKAHLADIDTSTLVYACVLNHQVSYNAGNYIPAARKFQRNLILLRLIYK